ncbi:pentapeptide repeat-containing protein [Escherichia coli]|nr:pentapeptide repeat-containing protein [Escherichia coli]MDY8351659.1 pentapeptide repeat-containing protein [Escherichia coli]
MGSTFNIYGDILPTLDMYSGLKPCHKKSNQPFDINTEIETIQKQINYDINHLNDGFIKRVLNVFIHLISNPDNLELTLNRYSSTTEQIIAKTKRNGLNEFEINDLKIIFNRQNDNESLLTVNHKDISHSCNVKTEQLQQFIKIMEQKAQLPIYIDKNNLKESIFSVLRNDPQHVEKEQYLPCDKFLTHACKSSNSFEVKLDATHQYQHLNNFMISFDPVENQLTIRDNNNETETISLTNLQWENVLQYYRENHQQPNIAGSRNITDNRDKIKNTISTSEIIECASPEIRSSVLNDLYSIANFLPDNNLTPNESWKRFCNTCERFYVAQKSITGDKSERLTRKLSISDAGITMTFTIGDVVINTISTAIPEDSTGQRCIEGLNLAGMDLTGIDLSKMVLRNVNFNGSILRNAKFSGTICEGVDFTDCDLRNAEFENASLEKIDFRKVRHLLNINFTNANLRNSNFSGKVLTGVNFTGTEGSNILFNHAWLFNTIFIDTIFKNACFFNAKVNNVSLKNAYLYNDNINKKANDSAEKQAKNSTDKQAKNSTEQQDSTSLNQARLKKEVNSSFSIPGLTSYQPTYIVEE